MTDTRIFRRKKTYNLFRGLPLSPKQARSLVRSTAKFNIWNGAIRSGKTFTTQLRWLQYLANPPKGGDFVMVGRTRDSIARNVIGPMQDPNIFGQFADHVKYTSGAPFAMIMGVRVYVLGASDAKAEKVIRGMTLAGAYVDEITILSQEFFTQLIGRLSVPGAQLFGTTNPDNPEHWLKKNYLDKIGPDKKNGQLWNWKAWFFQLTDNPTLTSGYRQTLESSFHGLFYKRFVLGQWVAAEGAVYDIFNHQQHVKDIDELCGDNNPIVKYLCIGADYGTTNATAAILLGMTRNGELYVVDEFVYKPSDRALRKTDAQLSHALREWINQKHDQYFPSAEETPVILDPAAASFHVQLRTDKTQTISAVNDVLYGIRLVTALLGAEKLFINPRCTNLISEFSGYTWDPKATAEGRDAVIKTNDHSLDALRYGISTTEKIWRRFIDISA